MPAPTTSPSVLATGGLEGDARMPLPGADAGPAGTADDAVPGTRSERATLGPGGVPADPPVGGINSPDQFGFLGSGSVACTIAGSPVPRLIVSLSDGDGSMPMGCPRDAVPGNDERD